MGHEGLRNLNFVPHDVLLFVRVFLAATVTAHTDLLRQHGEYGIGVIFSQEDFVFVAGVAFVVK